MNQSFELKDQAILDVAQLVLDEIKAIGADEGETWVSRSALTELYYELGKISMIRTVFSDNISLKLLKDKRKGTVSLNSFDPREVRQAVKEAWEASKAAAPDEAEGISDQEGAFSFSQGTQQPDLDKMYQQLDDLLSDARQKFPKISFDSIGIEHRYGERLYANSRGVRLSDASGAYQLSNMFMGKDGDATSSFNYFGTVYEDPSDRVFDSPRVERILAETESQIHTEQFEGSFVGDLVIMPGCLQSFLYDIQAIYTGDEALITGTSPWKECLGEEVAHPSFNLRLVASDPDLPAASQLTGDGYVAENMPLIENGLLKNFSLSRYASAKTGLPRSRNNSSIYVIEAGSESLANLISGVGKGLLLGRFSGGAPSPAGDLSGVAKNSFLIENGQVTKALSEVMIAGNLGQMLKDITGISQEQESSGYYRLPWVRVRGVNISGK